MKDESDKDLTINAIGTRVQRLPQRMGVGKLGLHLSHLTVIRLKPVQNQLVMRTVSFVLGRCLRNQFSERRLFKNVHTQNL